MKELYVHSSTRGARIGEKLMGWLARYAVQNQCALFDWTVDESNSEALRFYNELGAPHLTAKMYFRLAGASLNELAASDAREA